METIKNYLETMFANMPNTPEVRRAKDELWQMMEDKYNELVADGKSDNEAVGTVISEFGNLEEIAQDLGIEKETTSLSEVADRKKVSFEVVEDFLKDNVKHSLFIAIGVLLCIYSVIAPIVCESISVLENNDAAIGVSVSIMMVCIAIAVAFFIYAGAIMKPYSYFEKELCSLDFATTEFVKNERNRERAANTIEHTIGVVLCIICWIPCMLADQFHLTNSIVNLEDLSAALMFMLVGIGVFLIVYSANRRGAYDKLLKVNDRATISGNYSDEENYDNPVVASIMKVYWPTMTCIYLSWSFLTFDWHISWILWPIAGIVSKLIYRIFGKDAF